MVKHMVMWSFKEEIPEEKKPSSLIQVIEETEEDVGIHGL